MEPSSVKRRLTCILAADAVGYSKQMGQDEEGTIHVLQAKGLTADPGSVSRMCGKAPPCVPGGCAL